MEREASSEAASAVVLTISGMRCGGCASAVAHTLSSVPGVTTAKVDLASERAAVTGTAQVADLIRAIEAAGFGGQPSTT